MVTPPASAASAVPTTTPPVWDSPTQPDTVPRCDRGTWSGMDACSAAYAALTAACTPHQPITITSAFGAQASTAIDTRPTSTPPSTHGVRRPNRDVVRSDSAPNSGLLITDTAAPTPVTRL